MKDCVPRRLRRAIFCAMCASTLTLTACTGSGVPIREDLQTTLPPATETYAAPVGDAALDDTFEATLYLPRTDSERLVSVLTTVNGSATRPDAESVTRALLAYPGDSIASSLGSGVELSLYGANPVEVSGDVATVNLAASALKLGRKNLYICSRAIADTLTALDGINYVNVLVMDKEIGLDLASTLPTGSLSQGTADNVGAEYEQALAQRVGTDEDPQDKGLSVAVTLYFPLPTQNGIVAEVRNLTFADQVPSDMIEQIIAEIAEGPATVGGSMGLSALPALLTEAPEETDSSDGGKLITLRFDAGLNDTLNTAGVSRASCMGALCYTLCTFMPNVTGITAYIGGDRVDHVMLGSTSGLLFEDGIERRSDYAPLLMDECTLYFPNTENTALVKVRRPVAYYQKDSPRALLLELFGGPGDADSASNTLPIVNAGALTDADILGVALDGQTLLVNLSANFSAAGQGLSTAQDRLTAYAIVNTLLESNHADRVCFFAGGETPTDFSGEIYWAGCFYSDPGLVAGS
jgi:uncharacterized ParB-like nuclease family protein